MLQSNSFHPVSGGRPKQALPMHSVHCEVANVRLRPCLHLPHKSPDLLYLHCLSVSLKVNLTLSDVQ